MIVTPNGIPADQAAQLVSPEGKAVSADTVSAPTNGDVIARASKKCKTCHGSGQLRVWAVLTQCEDPAGCGKFCVCEPNLKVRVPKVCGCAVRGWEKLTGCDVRTGKPKAEA